jgi:hypothetical protein
MRSMIKSAVLSVGLLAATGLAVQAQSVSSVPPNTSSTPTAPAQPYVSTQRIVPDPGGSVSIKDEHYQGSANTASTLTDHPYSGSIDGAKSGPKPN